MFVSRRPKAGVGAIELHEHVDGTGRHQDGGEASQGDKNACAAHSNPLSVVCGRGLRWRPTFGFT